MCCECRGGGRGGALKKNNEQAAPTPPTQVMEALGRLVDPARPWHPSCLPALVATLPALPCTRDHLAALAAKLAEALGRGDVAPGPDTADVCAAAVAMLPAAPRSMVHVLRIALRVCPDSALDECCRALRTSLLHSSAAQGLVLAEYADLGVRPSVTVTRDVPPTGVLSDFGDRDLALLLMVASAGPGGGGGGNAWDVDLPQGWLRCISTCLLPAPRDATMKETAVVAAASATALSTACTLITSVARHDAYTQRTHNSRTHMPHTRHTQHQLPAPRPTPPTHAPNSPGVRWSGTTAARCSSPWRGTGSWSGPTPTHPCP